MQSSAQQRLTQHSAVHLAVIAMSVLDAVNRTSGQKLLMLGDSQAEISTLAAIKNIGFEKLVKRMMFAFRFLITSKEQLLCQMKIIYSVKVINLLKSNRVIKSGYHSANSEMARFMHYYS